MNLRVFTDSGLTFGFSNFSWIILCSSIRWHIVSDFLFFVILAVVIINIYTLLSDRFIKVKLICLKMVYYISLIITFWQDILIVRRSKVYISLALTELLLNLDDNLYHLYYILTVTSNKCISFENVLFNVNVYYEI